MIIASPLYVRVVAADRDRGFVLLVSWTKPVIQRTAHQMSTLSELSREYIDKVIANAVKTSKVTEVIDVTDSGIKKQLAKIFGEVVEKPKKEKSIPNESESE